MLLINFYDDCSGIMSSLFDVSYFSEELFKFNNLGRVHIRWNWFFSSVYKAFVIENTLSTDALVLEIAIEYSKIVQYLLRKLIIF